MLGGLYTIREGCKPGEEGCKPGEEGCIPGERAVH